MSIPKKIHQIWIGPLPAPTKWLNTWKEKNPDWEYIFWDNDKVFSRKWRNQKMIDCYKARAEKRRNFVSARGFVFTGEKATLFAWHVIADIIRYEILHEEGGYLASADAKCIAPLSEKAPWLEHDLFTVNTGHLFIERLQNLQTNDPHYKLNTQRYAPENASPVLASSKGNEFVEMCIQELGKLEENEYGEAVDTTGNVFMGKMLKKYPPSNALITPYYRKKDLRRKGGYSVHFSGTTRSCYQLGR